MSTTSIPAIPAMERVSIREQYAELETSAEASLNVFSNVDGDGMAWEVNAGGKESESIIITI